MGSDFKGRVPRNSRRWAIIGDATKITTFTNLFVIMYLLYFLICHLFYLTSDTVILCITKILFFVTFVGEFKTLEHGINLKLEDRSQKKKDNVFA